MTTITQPSAATGSLQLATFYLGDLLLGIDIGNIQEITRMSVITPVPHAPPLVRGVINLRGEVVTIVDLRRVLSLGDPTGAGTARNVIIQFEGELIGLMVDRVSDIVTLDPDEVTAPPANVSGVEGRFFTGVVTTDSDIIVFLDLNEVLTG